LDWYVNAQDPVAIRDLRREIADYLRRHAADQTAVPDAELAVQELLGNALRHSPGTAWVSIDWAQAEPVVTVHDLGPDFALEPSLPAVEEEGGRGLYIVAHLTESLTQVAKAAGGNAVSARLAVRRPTERSYDPPRRRSRSLPALEERQEEGGFGKESFLRAIVVQLAQSVEHLHGPEAAEAAVAQVGVDVGAQMEEEYRLAKGIVDRLTPEQMADAYVRLKHAIDGDFYAIEVTTDRIVLGNRACPFGAVVMKAPSLCRMTSSVFGGIAARNAENGLVVLEERIAVGDPQCRIVIHLGAAPERARDVGHHYGGNEGPVEPANGSPDAPHLTDR
jgi:anti-sigma regulatory factor (Ser/Thr protein kinase)/predicted ArsR family transcriptional regulator